MIIGAHSILYTTDAEADRAFFRDVLGLDFVDDGGGWLIFALPPSEVAVHPSGMNGKQEFYLLVEDIEAFRAKMAEAGTPCTGVHAQEWGKAVMITLPSGASLGVYEPLHARPEPA